MYKKLAGQTLIYGLGTVVPRLLNYSILTFYYTRLFSVSQFGIITELYAYVTFLLVLLTYGMETGFFRFTKENDKKTVYSSVFKCILSTSLLFFIAIVLFRKDIAELLNYEDNVKLIVMLAAIVSIDAICAIPFAKLRIEERSKRFAILKILNVVITIFCVLLFYEILPNINKYLHVEVFKAIRNDVSYVIIANLIASISMAVLLIPEILFAKGRIDYNLIKNILKYSLPILIAGLAGTANETLDRILLKYLIIDKSKALYALGIYGANYKIALLILLFTQVFRFTIEPFYFNYYGKKDEKVIFAQILRLFVVITFILSLTILIFIDYFKLFIDKKFHEGLNIVPIIIYSYIFYGMFFNLSIWYKLTKKTLYGAFITLIGAIITIAINIIFVRKYSYMASAYAHLIAYFIMMILSYIIGQKFYKVDYKILRILEYSLIACSIYFVTVYCLEKYLILKYISGLCMIFIYGFYVLRRENLLNIKLLFYENKNS